MKLDNFGLTRTGRLLLAMPSVTEPAFRKSLILICAHSPTGAMGLLINRPAPKMTLRQLLEELGGELPEVTSNLPINAGGPADIERPFVVHSSDYFLDAHTLRVTRELSMTPHPDVVQDIARRSGPKHAFVALGYCAWVSGQLEKELQAGHWLTAVPTTKLLFNTPSANRWTMAMEGLGISPSSLSGYSGHA